MSSDITLAGYDLEFYLKQNNVIEHRRIKTLVGRVGIIETLQKTINEPAFLFGGACTFHHADFAKRDHASVDQV